MNFMQKYIIFFLVLTYMLSSCQKDATNVKLPPAKVQLVIHCFISPQDTLVKVYVSESTPIFGYKRQNNGFNIQSLPDAKVQISHNGTVYDLKFSSNDEAYIIDTSILKIVAGETYDLKATRGNESASASCTVPASLPFDVKLDKYVTKYDIDPFTKDTFYSYRIQTSLTDLGTEHDYYRVNIGCNSLSWSYLYDQMGNKVDSQLSTFFNEGYFENTEEEFISDEEGNGKAYIQNSTVSLGSNMGGSKPIPTELLLGIMHTDKNYYLFHTSAFAHMNNQGNPFAEPSLIYTNIQGGLGIFAAYNYRYWIKKL